MLGAVLSVQLGAALATTLFDELGPTATVFLRSGFAAALLALLWRPRIAGHRGDELRVAVLFGVSLAGMNLCFYQALDRLPLGIAVTLEFVGPLGVAVAGSRRALDLLWVALAAGGIVLLSGGPGGELDALGMVLALGAGALWGAYILLSARVGRVFPGGTGLAIAMIVSAALLAPAGIAGGGAELLHPALLAVGVAVSLLSSAIPYSLELEALRRVPEAVFGVLMSLEPAVAASVGFVALGQDLAVIELLAIGMVIVASAGALGSAPSPAPTEA